MSADPVSPIDQLAALADLQRRFLETARRADRGTPIPWLGRWKVEQLVVHLARIHHWAAGQARREQEAPLGRGPFDDLPGLYGACAAELRATLAELDPDARAWALVDDGVPKGEQTGTVRFWHRRQLHETLVHLWDLRTAVGEPLDADGPPIDDALWADCLDEVVTVMHPRQLRLGRVAPPAARLVFAPTGADASPALTGAPEGAAEIVIAGPAQSLALLAWGRLPLADAGLEVRGDRDAAAAVLAAGLTP